MQDRRGMNDSVKKIVLEVGGVEVSLTPEQALKLQSDLNQLFGKVETIPAPWPTWPYWYPTPVTYGSDQVTITTTDTDGMIVRMNA